MTAEEVSLQLFADLQRFIPDQVKAVFDADHCEIEPDFLGFIEIYAALAAIIPHHWRVLDLGCYAAPQAYFFRDHEAYIGVDTWEGPRFSFPNTVQIQQEIGALVRSWTLPTADLFAICSYVPLQGETAEQVRRRFPNLFVYYPHGTPPGGLSKVSGS